MEERRLEAFEKMLEAVQREYCEIQNRMEDQKKKDRTKSATYRQLMGRKVMYQNMLSLYELYGLLPDQETTCQYGETEM